MFNPNKLIQKPVLVIEGLPHTQLDENSESHVEELFT
jgi:hypothetical protein